MYIYELFFAALATSNQTTGFSDFYQNSLELIKALSYLVLVFFGFIGLVTLGILILSVLVIILFIQYFPLLYDYLGQLALYHPLIKNKKICDSEDCEFGENLKEKIWKVFICNFWIALPLFLVLLFLVHPTNSTLATAFNMTNGSASPQILPPSNSPDMSQSDISFFLTLSLIPAFILSYRLLVNPTFDGIIIFKNGATSGFTAAVNNFIEFLRIRQIPEERQEMISEEERKLAIRSYKEQVKSFYFSFIGASLILLLLFISFRVMETPGTYDVIEEFSPTMNPVIAALMIIAEIVAIFIATAIGEIYLKWAEPIDQI